MKKYSYTKSVFLFLANCIHLFMPYLAILHFFRNFYQSQGFFYFYQEEFMQKKKHSSHSFMWYGFQHYFELPPNEPHLPQPELLKQKPYEEIWNLMVTCWTYEAGDRAEHSYILQQLYQAYIPSTYGIRIPAIVCIMESYSIISVVDKIS